MQSMQAINYSYTNLGRGAVGHQNWYDMVCGAIMDPVEVRTTLVYQQTSPRLMIYLENQQKEHFL